MSTKFGVDSSSSFPFKVRTHRPADTNARCNWSSYPCIGDRRRR